MKLEIQVLALVECLILITQVIVLFIQYRMNKTYRGVGWWVLGSASMSLGVIFMPMLTIKSLEMLARVANPLVVLGQIFLYIGILQFLDKKGNRLLLSSIFVIFAVSYYYYMYFDNDISGRTVVVNATLATICAMSSYNLYFKKDRLISISTNFTATIFLVYGCLLTARTLYTLMSPPVRTYSDQEMVFIAAFIVPIIISTLWTFGFIIMLNQRLNVENRESEEKYRSILNASPDDITITDLEGHIIMVSPAAKKMFGYERGYEEFIGKQLVDFIVPEDIERAKSNIVQMYQGGPASPNEYHGVRKDQSIFDIEVNSGFISNSNGQQTKMVFVIRDITERKQAEQKIQLLVKQLEIERNTAHLNSITDSLTELANRRYFDEALVAEFYRLKRSGAVLSLIMLDVDYFKKYNDTYGHLAGDECLRKIGTMLKTIVGRVSDIVARYGGEEFVLILPETEEEGASALAEKIRKDVIELAIPHSASDISEYVTVSLGVVSVSTTEFVSPEQIMTLVDKALYCAKQGGRNRVEVCAYLPE